MAILIEPKGLLEGRRLRKLNYKARLYYPYLLSMTNFYARVELDPEVISLKLALIKDPSLNEDEIACYFDDYARHGLCFLYDAKGSRWAQFDTPVSLRRHFASSEDNSSPAPPKAEYIAWLKSLHGDDWEEYNLSEYQQTISEKRAEAGRKGGAASGEARRSKTNAASANEPVVVDVGEAVEDEVEDEEVVEVGSTLPSATEQKDIRSALSNSNFIQNGKTETETSDEEYTPEELAECFHLAVQSNPRYDAAKLPRKWKTLWADDFRLLLHSYDSDSVHELIAASQSSGQAQYNVRPEAVIKNIEILFKVIAKLKTGKAWNPIWDAYLSKIGADPDSASPPSEEEIEFLGESDPVVTVADCMKESCPFCGHLRLGANPCRKCKFDCPICPDGKTFTGLSMFQGHIRYAHPQHAATASTVCGTTSNIEDENDELAQAHADPPFGGS